MSSSAVENSTLCRVDFSTEYIRTFETSKSQLTTSARKAVMMNDNEEQSAKKQNPEDTKPKGNLREIGQGDVLPDEYEEEIQKAKYRRYNELALLGIRVGFFATLHPFEYAKVLMQLGHEPLPFESGKSVWANGIRAWPNIFRYVGHIRSVDGVFGCYRGFAPKMWAFTVSFFGAREIVDQMGLLSVSPDNHDKDESYDHFIATLKSDVALTATSIILSHPFHVISIRMMAQFVGRETVYNSILRSFLEIYRTDGLAGFFAGLVPKLICDVSCVVLTGSISYLINKYCVKDELIRELSGSTVQFVFAQVLYPLQVISTCMAVSNSNLYLAKPPKMFPYKNWIECLLDFRDRGEYHRGAGLFWR